MNGKEESQETLEVVLSDYTSSESSVELEPEVYNKIKEPDGEAIKTPAYSQDERKNKYKPSRRNDQRRKVSSSHRSGEKRIEYTCSGCSSSSSSRADKTNFSVDVSPYKNYYYPGVRDYCNDRNCCINSCPCMGCYVSQRKCADSVSRLNICHTLCSNKSIPKLTKVAMEIIERENTLAKFLWKFILLIQGEDPICQNFDPESLMSYPGYKYFYYVVYELLNYSTEIMNRIGEIRIRLLRAHAQKKALIFKLMSQINLEREMSWSCCGANLPSNVT